MNSQQEQRASSPSLALQADDGGATRRGASTAIVFAGNAPPQHVAGDLLGHAAHSAQWLAPVSALDGLDTATLSPSTVPATRHWTPSFLGHCSRRNRQQLVPLLRDHVTRIPTAAAANVTCCRRRHHRRQRYRRLCYCSSPLRVGAAP